MPGPRPGVGGGKDSAKERVPSAAVEAAKKLPLESFRAVQAGVRPNQAGSLQKREEPVVQVKQWILEAGGTLLEPDSGVPGGEEEIIRALIPVENYSSLLENLSRLGKLQPPGIDPTSWKGRKILPVGIQIVFPQE